jgi:hypothetical protein
MGTLVLVSTASDEFRLELPLESATWACREAVASMDWHLEYIAPHRLVLKRSFGFLNMSEARIEILLSEAGPDATTVTLNGKLSWGIGRWDMRTLTSLMNTVRNAVEVAARSSSSRAARPGRSRRGSLEVPPDDTHQKDEQE